MLPESHFSDSGCSLLSWRIDSIPPRGEAKTMYHAMAEGARMPSAHMIYAFGRTEHDIEYT